MKNTCITKNCYRAQCLMNVRLNNRFLLKMNKAVVKCNIQNPKKSQYNFTQ